MCQISDDYRFSTRFSGSTISVKRIPKRSPIITTSPLAITIPLARISSGSPARRSSSITDPSFRRNKSRILSSVPPTTTVYMSGLSGDFKQRGWPGMENVMALCDDVFFLKAKCTICNEDAPFTVRKGTNSTDLVVCGGTDIYEPRCRKCVSSTI